MREKRVLFTTRNIPNLPDSLNNVVDSYDHEPLWKKTSLRLATDGYGGGGGSRGDHCKLACASMAERKVDKQLVPTLAQLLRHPLAAGAFVPKDASLFFAGAIAGAAAKTVTARRDRIKILMQTHGVLVGQESAKKAIGFIGAFNDCIDSYYYVYIKFKCIRLTTYDIVKCLIAASEEEFQSITTENHKKQTNTKIQ